MKAWWKRFMVRWGVWYHCPVIGCNYEKEYPAEGDWYCPYCAGGGQQLLVKS
jgi:hypothetical protein